MKKTLADLLAHDIPVIRVADRPSLLRRMFRRTPRIVDGLSLALLIAHDEAATSMQRTTPMDLEERQ